MLIIKRLVLKTCRFLLSFFSETSAEDGVFLEFFDHKGTLLAKLPMVGNLAHLQ
jgi:hypothetical protein